MFQLSDFRVARTHLRRACLTSVGSSTCVLMSMSMPMSMRAPAGDQDLELRRIVYATPFQRKRGTNGNGHNVITQSATVTTTAIAREKLLSEFAWSLSYSNCLGDYSYGPSVLVATSYCSEYEIIGTNTQHGVGPTRTNSCCDTYPLY
jgi:hypothetical protein